MTAVRSMLVQVGVRGAAPYTAQMGTMATATRGFATSARNVGPAGAAASAGIARTTGSLGLLNPKLLGPAGLVVGMTKAVGASVDFGEEQIKLRTQIGLTADETAAAGQAARDVGRQWGIGGQEAIEASFFIHSAGLRGAEATEALARSAQAAALGLGETKVIADTVTSAMNAYGPAVLDAHTATATLLAGVREGKFEADQLAGALGRVLPTASALNIPFEDIVSSLSIWSRLGMPVTESMTSLQAIMSTLLGTSEQGAEALESVGLSLEELREMAAQPGGLVEVMRTLDSAFDGNLETMRDVVPNVRAFRGVMATLATEAGIVDDVVSGVADATGDFDDALQMLEETSTRFQWERFKANVGAAGRSVGDILNPALRDTLQLVNALTDEGARLFGAGPEMTPERQAELLSHVDIGALPPQQIDPEAVGRERRRMLDDLNDIREATGLVIDEFGNVRQVGRRTWGDIADVTGDAADETERLTEATLEYRGAISSTRGPIDALDSALERVDQAQRDYNDALDDHGSSSDEAQRAAWELFAALDGLEQAALDGDISFDQFSDRLDLWVARGRITHDQAALIRDRMRELLSELGLFDGGVSEHTLRIHGLDTSLQRLNTLRSLLRQTTGTSITVTESGNLIARQHGGRVWPGQTFLVGEQGPELVQFGSHGNVIAAPETAQIMGHGQPGSSFVANINLADGAQGDRLVRRLERFALEGI